jgi:hypothetical protein
MVCSSSKIAASRVVRRLLWALSRSMVASAASMRGEQLADEQAVVEAEAAGQRLLELGELGGQAALGQLGQDHGVAHAGDQGLQHRPATAAQDVAGHPRQLGCRRPLAACSSRWAWRVGSWTMVLR